jgi:cytochrome bd-type quinol oxidase subunit 2
LAGTEGNTLNKRKATFNAKTIVWVSSITTQLSLAIFSLGVGILLPVIRPPVSQLSLTTAEVEQLMLLLLLLVLLLMLGLMLLQILLLV